MVQEPGSTKEPLNYQLKICQVFCVLLRTGNANILCVSAQSIFAFIQYGTKSFSLR